jgi:hypothetical protein
MEAEIRAQLMESNAQLANSDQGAYEEKLAAMRAEFEAESKQVDVKAEKMKTTPYIMNMNEDEALSGMVVHFFEEGDSTIGQLR